MEWVRFFFYNYKKDMIMAYIGLLFMLRRHNTIALVCNDLRYYMLMTLIKSETIISLCTRYKLNTSTPGASELPTKQYGMGFSLFLIK